MSRSYLEFFVAKGKNVAMYVDIQPIKSRIPTATLVLGSNARNLIGEIKYIVNCTE